MHGNEAGRGHAAGSLIYGPDSYVDPLNLAKVFPAAQPLEVELGSGDGGFLATWAAQHPDRNFLGVERLLGRLRKLDRKGLRARLENLRLIRIEAGYFTRYLLPPASAQAVHLYFPDPWPKRRHWKHRLVNAVFLDAVARALEPGGRIHVRTDNEAYFEQITTLLAADTRFLEVGTPPDLAAVLTDFERDFLAAGVPTLRVSCQRRP